MAIANRVARTSNRLRNLGVALVIAAIACVAARADVALAQMDVPEVLPWKATVAKPKPKPAVKPTPAQVANPAAAQRVEVRLQLGHQNINQGLEFDASGRFLVSADRKSAKLWDVKSGLLLRTFPAEALNVAIAPDAKYVITDHEHNPKVMVWDAASGKLLRTMGDRIGSVFDIEISPDGKLVAGAMVDGSVRVWEIATGRQVHNFDTVAKHPHLAPNAVAFSPDGRQLAVATEQPNKTDNLVTQTIQIWELASRRRLRVFEIERKPEQLQFSLDGKNLFADGVAWSTQDSGADAGVQLAKEECATEGVTREIDGYRRWRETTRELAGPDFTPRQSPCGTVAISRQGSIAFWGAVGSIEIRDIETGELLKVLGTAEGLRSSGQGSDDDDKDINIGDSTLSADGTQLALATLAGMQILQLPAGRHLLTLAGSEDLSIRHPVFSPNGDLVAARVCLPHAIAEECPAAGIWSTRTGDWLQLLHIKDQREVHELLFLGDGGAVTAGIYLSGRKTDSGLQDALVTWDTATGKIVRAFDVEASGAIAAPKDGSQVLTGGGDHLEIWNPLTGKRAHTAKSTDHSIGSMALDGSGTRVALGHDAEPDWPAALILRDASAESVLWKRDLDMFYATPIKPAFSHDGRFIVTAMNTLLLVLDAANGKTVRSLSMDGDIRSVSIDARGTIYASDSYGALMMCRSLCAGERLQRVPLGASGHLWITSAGFFDQQDGEDLPLHLVRGMDAISLDYVYEHLHRPDLVEALLGNDPEGKYKNAAQALNIEKIMASGLAPQLEHVSSQDDRAGNTVQLTVRITALGGGIGKRLLWRVNGVTQGRIVPEELSEGSAPLASAVVTETLRLTPGKNNVVEVTAYNRSGLLATPPLRITIDAFGATTAERPRLFVLALGVDDYRMKEFKLSYAANDAVTFAKALDVAGRDLFADVKTRHLTNGEVTRERIAAAMSDIAKDVRAEDVFALFLGGHGRSIAGSYYYYPQTLDFSAGETVETHGIGQKQWEEWLAQIKVEKSLLVIDTCEGDAFRGSRGADTARQAAMSQLQHATGRNVISASREAAYEDYQGHGVLTYAILEALDRSKGGSDDSVRVSALANYVGTRVPEISQKAFGIYQNPTRKLTGNDFPIGIRQSVLTAAAGEGPAIPQEPSHVLTRPELLRQKPAADAPASRELAAGTLVRAVEFHGDWVIIARDGQKLGYVPVEALVRLQ